MGYMLYIKKQSNEQVQWTNKIMVVTCGINQETDVLMFYLGRFYQQLCAISARCNTFVII